MLFEMQYIVALILSVVSFLLALGTSAHVVLYKRDVRAAIGWMGAIWFAPFLGSFLYYSFGINRVHRKAKHMLASTTRRDHIAREFHVTAESRADKIAREQPHLESLVAYGDKVLDRPLLKGNLIEPFANGDDAYQAMLTAIEQAKSRIALETYIFDNDRAGQRFIAALSAAVKRGVEVRVIVDDVGSRYSWPSIRTALRRENIPHTTFLPTLIPWKLHYSNLRNHRKILVVDGRLAFTGGMNIREGHQPSLHPSNPIEDMHFRVTGPVVSHLMETFAFDWEFCTGKTLADEHWFPEPTLAGEVFARGISDGPDHDHDKLRLTLMGALACAKHSVTIVTPYFLPDDGLIGALNTADLRGVDVQIVLPAENNLALVQWASTAMLWQILSRGVQVWVTPPPFDHTKLVIVDGYWVLLGSANWDPRSLRLNFEFNVECFDASLAHRLQAIVSQKIATANPFTLADVDGRSLPIRLRDGVARLLSPYL